MASANQSKGKENITASQVRDVLGALGNNMRYWAPGAGSPNQSKEKENIIGIVKRYDNYIKIISNGLNESGSQSIFVCSNMSSLVSSVSGWDESWFKFNQKIAKLLGLDFGSDVSSTNSGNSDVNVSSNIGGGKLSLFETMHNLLESIDNNERAEFSVNFKAFRHFQMTGDRVKTAADLYRVLSFMQLYNSCAGLVLQCKAKDLSLAAMDLNFDEKGLKAVKSGRDISLSNYFEKLECVNSRKEGLNLNMVPEVLDKMTKIFPTKLKDEVEVIATPPAKRRKLFHTPLANPVFSYHTDQESNSGVASNSGVSRVTSNSGVINSDETVVVRKADLIKAVSKITAIINGLGK